MNQADKERFFSFLEVSENCWMWKGGVNSRGYGVFWAKGKSWRAHRVSYEIHEGEIPEGLIVRHKCDTPLCCNPKHLELGTHQDNAQDRMVRNRGASGSRNGSAFLTEKDVAEIRDLANCGLFTQATIGFKYGVKQAIVSKIKLRQNWK